MVGRVCGALRRCLASLTLEPVVFLLMVFVGLVEIYI